MKDTKAVYATTYDLNTKFNREYELFANRAVRIDSSDESNKKTKDFGCQYDKNSICTCKRIKRKEIRYYTSSRQVFRSQRYSSARGFTDIGVGNIKTLPKKKIRRIYLPETIETGVGSSELIPFFCKTKNWGAGYYDQKKTSSKCIGGVMDCTNILVVSEKLSPITQKVSGSNSPRVTSNKNINKTRILANNEPTCSKTEEIQTPSPTNNVISKKQKEAIATFTEVSQNNCKKSNERITTTVNKAKSTTIKGNIDEKDFSSDSLIEHVHNLEDPSDYKQSRISIDFIENKLEREYRKIFTSNPKERKPADDKTVSDFKSASTLRRRFEALRRGISKKDDANTDLVTMKLSSRASVPSKKDVSIVSDPPSLEARSYSNTNIFRPRHSVTSPTRKNKVIPHAQTSSRKSLTGKKRPSHNWSTDIVDSDCQGVKGMFNLWGKKFYLEDNNDKVSPTNPEKNNKERAKKVNMIVSREEVVIKKKKEGKRFSFFRKRSKDKSKQTYKSKKGITAGRCEVDGLMIKIGAAHEYPPEPPLKKSHPGPEEFNDILRKAWLKRFLGTKVDSKHSAQIRWNNNMYTTSSSTVFELIDCVYKNTGIIFRSKSEMTNEKSSLYHSFTKPQVNFMHQSIQVWMIPETTRDNQMVNFNTKKDNKNIEVRYSNQKWFIEKSKAFERKIEVVLHSNNLVKQANDNSSDYIVIDIPEGYFSDTSSNDEDPSQTSDEQVYNIVEYETANSNSYINKQKKDNKMETGDHASNDIQVTVSVKDSKNIESNILETVIKRPPIQRDVVVQGSKVYVPKRCDVISVGIITQRDIRDIKKPILKIQDELTDDSEHILPPQKKCEFAESYLQDYYRNWTPLGIDFFSWCVSDSHLRGSSENNSLNSLNQGDGSKSCPNIYDDYQAPTIVSSCKTSSCSNCLNLENEQTTEEQQNRILVSKIKKKSDTPDVSSDTRRILPKDSLEVYKRRKIYALSNRAIWATMDGTLEPYCVPSIEDKCEPKSSNGYPFEVRKPKKCSLKHVSMQNCDVFNEQLSDKCVEGILSFKGKGGSFDCKKSGTHVKRARVISEPTAEIPEPPCKNFCAKKRKPPCSKTNSPSCFKPPPPVCPVGSPSLCQDPCPPVAPPCTRHSPCPISPFPLSKPPSTKISPRSPSPPPNKICPKSSSPPPTKICPRCPSPPPTKICPRTPSPPQNKVSPRSPLPPPTKICPRCPSPPQMIVCPRSPSPPPTKICSRCPSPTQTIVCPRSPSPPPTKICPRSPSPPQTKVGPRSPSPPPTKICPRSSSPQLSPSKIIPPKIHSPPPMDPLQRPCVCPPIESSCDSQEPSVVKKLLQLIPIWKYGKCEHSSSSLTPPCTPPPSRKSCPCPSPPKPPNCSSSKGTSPPGQIPFPKTCDSQEFPWSTKNIRSNTPSKESGISLRIGPNRKISEKVFGQVKGLIKNMSGSSIKKQCCSKRPKVANSHSKMPGIHLKKLPMQKRDSKECLSKGDEEYVIRLNSKEKITIKLRQGSPSTDEIREGCCDMKCQDEDGHTLYERKDYHRNDNRTLLVKEMYTDSQIQRLATSKGNMLGVNLPENDMTPSIPNIIEINLSLKFKQGDKTKMNVNHISETQKDLENVTDAQIESSKEVYLIHDQPKILNGKTEKKDLDIKIVIKNHKQQPIKSQHCVNVTADENFSKKISEKFHTVSTVYSDVTDQQAYSLHRTTIDLTNSNENQKVQDNPSKVLVIEPLIENKTSDMKFEEKIIPKDPLNSSNLMITENLNNEDEVSVSSQTNSIIGVKMNSEKTDETNDERSETGLSASDDEDAVTSDVKHESDDNILIKIHKKEDKKAVLKEIFENADKIKSTGNKSKMQNIRKMLRAVLTSDSSAHEDITVNNELANELTYGSLKPNYFKNSESMTNFYLHDSSISFNKGSLTDFEDMLCPTAADDSECSAELCKNENSNCLCSQFAAKLNIQQNCSGCCCCTDKRDKEIVCDIIDENYYKCKTDYIDVETQDSKCFEKIKTNVTNHSVIITEEELDRVTKQKFNQEETFNPFSKTIKACQMKGINRSTILGLSDDDKVVIFDSNTELSLPGSLKAGRMKPADILQSQETKKAVLEIYAEKTVSNKGERIVARLPKFVYIKQSEIRHYRNVLKTYSKRNIVMMSIIQ